MDYFGPGARVSSHEQLKLLPCKALALASSIQPFEHDICRPIKKCIHLFTVMRDAIVLYVTSQFRLENFPHFFHRSFVPDLLSPLLHPLEFRFHGFRSSFQFRYYLSCLRFPTIERKSEKVECPLFHALRRCPSIKRDELRLFFIELKLKLFK